MHVAVDVLSVLLALLMTASAAPKLIDAKTAQRNRLHLDLSRELSRSIGALIEGVSRINRSNCQPSAETLSGITRRQNVKHQPTSYTSQCGPGRIRTCDTGFRRAC